KPCVDAKHVGQCKFRLHTTRLFPAPDFQDEKVIATPEDIEIIFLPKLEIRGHGILSGHLMAVVYGGIDVSARLQPTRGDLHSEEETIPHDEWIGVGVRGSEINEGFHVMISSGNPSNEVANGVNLIRHMPTFRGTLVS